MTEFTYGRKKNPHFQPGQINKIVNNDAKSRMENIANNEEMLEAFFIYFTLNYYTETQFIEKEVSIINVQDKEIIEFFTAYLLLKHLEKNSLFRTLEMGSCPDFVLWDGENEFTAYDPCQITSNMFANQALTVEDDTIKQHFNKKKININNLKEKGRTKNLEVISNFIRTDDVYIGGTQSTIPIFDIYNLDDPVKVQIFNSQFAQKASMAGCNNGKYYTFQNTDNTPTFSALLTVPQ